MPSARPLSEVLAWATIGLLLAFLVWQVGSGRLRLPFLTRPVSLAPASDPLPVTTAVDDTIRIVNDLSLTLWTAQREPEARFVATDTLAGLPAIRVPADSRLSYDMTVPLNGRLRTGLVADGSGQLRFVVRFGDEEIATQTVTAISEEDSEEIAWLDLDLSRWAGRAGPLRLVTESVGGTPDGLWIMPQVQATPTWLLSHPLPADVRAQSAGYQFGDGVELVGYEVTPPSPGAGEPATVTLYWRALSRLDAYATVFVHLLDDQGQIRAQHDGQPVSNTYPLPTWQPGTVIADRHPLSLPDDLANGHYTLAVGLYDPGSLERWPVVGPDGRPQPDNRALLTTSLSVGATP